jgi:hypothetical protein
MYILMPIVTMVHEVLVPPVRSLLHRIGLFVHVTDASVLVGLGGKQRVGGVSEHTTHLE